VKKISVLMTGMLVFLISFCAVAQDVIPVEIKEISPYQLGIGYSKTTNLIYPYAVVSVDRGSKDVLAQKAKGMENILQVKAGKMGFDETNLTVVTSDGHLYSYILSYLDNPTSLNIKYEKASGKPAANFSAPELAQESAVRAAGEKVMNIKPFIANVKDRKFGQKFRLEGIYIRGEVMYFQVSLKNNSNINYDIDQLRFYVRDQKKAKRTASQELELHPLQVINDISVVQANSQNVFVFALDKITIPDQKEMTIQCLEKSGGRHLELKFGNKTILKARTVNN